MANNQVDPSVMGISPQENFLGREASEDLFNEIETFRAANPFGRPTLPYIDKVIPRGQMLVYFGEKNLGTTYSYSGITVPSIKAPAFLLDLHAKIQAAAGVPLGYALINEYSPGDAQGVGEDCISFHRDKAEAVDGTTIYSYTVGGERFFRVKRDCPAADPAYQWCKLRMKSDTMLALTPEVNRTCLHGVPRSNKSEIKALGASRNRTRYNITFRQRV